MEKVIYISLFAVVLFQGDFIQLKQTLVPLFDTSVSSFPKLFSSDIFYNLRDKYPEVLLLLFASGLVKKKHVTMLKRQVKSAVKLMKLLQF